MGTSNRTSLLIVDTQPEKLLPRVIYVSTVVAVVAVLLVSLAAWVYLRFTAERGMWSHQVTGLKVFFNAYKAIGVGFLVAILAAVLPLLVPAERYRFDRFKESRIAYSNAKTAIMYLPAVITDMQYSDAICSLVRAHKDLHLAESYDELKTHLRYDPDRDSWGLRKFWELRALNIALTDNIDIWNETSGSSRLKLLQELLDEVRKVFEEKARIQREHKVSESGTISISDVEQKNLLERLHAKSRALKSKVDSE